MIRLANARFKLDVSPRFGARWMRLRVNVGGAWKDLLWPPPSINELQRNPLFGGGFLMAPWCNRIPDARFDFRREGVVLRSNFDDGSAIHGDVYGRAWTVVSESSASLTVSLDTRRERDFNFPFDLVFGHRIRLLGSRVEASLAVINVGRDVAPAGLGFHPFFLRRLSPRGKTASITIPAQRVFPSENAIPTGPARAVSGRFDVRSPVSLDAREFDSGYTGLAGRPVQIHYPGEGLDVHLTPGAEARHLYVWAPRRFERAAAPFFCVEPMSMSVNGFARLKQDAWDHGVRLLAPKERFSISWTIEVGETR